MVLETRPSTHNEMLGRLVKHPPSTNYEDTELCPPAKRLKRLDSADSDSPFACPGPDDDDNDKDLPPDARPAKEEPEIADSEAESDDDDDESPSLKQTDLESALPPVKTDKQAIADYEASRAAEGAEGLLPDIQGRLGKGKWTRGHSSIYVDAFNLALETVLEDEAGLFDDAEMKVFECWRGLDYEAQYLYVRLFLRKTAVWHRINRLGYYSDIADLPAAVKILQEEHTLPASTSVQDNPGEGKLSEGTTLGESFTFADRSEVEITTLEEGSSLLKLDELKGIAKDAKVQGKNKRELLIALRNASQKQGGLGWRSLSRSNTEDDAKTPDSRSDGNESPSKNDITTNRDEYFIQKIFNCTGPCVRLSLAPLKLFERVHLVFYRSTEWTEKSLITIILARISRRNFPEYIVSRSSNIFPSRSILLEFEASIRTQFRIDNILEFNGTPTKDGLGKILGIFEDVLPRWRSILEEEQQKEDRVYESGEGAYLRRFSPGWVYTRIVHKGAYVLGRFKMHRREHEILTELLSQRLFHLARRGDWYQRKALLEEHYMAALEDEPPEGRRNPDAQKKHWKRIALQTCEAGLQDRDCHLIYQYDLQKRIAKLERSLKIAKREQHDFGHVRLAKPTERTVEGVQVQREETKVGDARGAKTIWIDEREGGGECSVEAMCLSWYRDQGWKGYHSEGGIMRTLFAYLFADILFLYLPNVFQTAFQTCPLDLHTDAFYPSRASEINRRLAEIANGDAERLVKEVHAREHERATCIVGLNWAFEIADLLEIVRSFNGEALSAVCKVMAQEYAQRGGGMPDLFLWRPPPPRDGDTLERSSDGEEDGEKGEVMFAEVKSENDRLSDTQRLWIHVLTGAGVRVELCHAVAKATRT
ncbi:MAG: hypothetical protein M1819_002509 [Sarea resinae]|nr:MAG: hypothetical protein M1819_002509 [Sarea resinae]